MELHENYYWVNICKPSLIAFIGQKIDFEEVNFLHLNVGDKVCEIGNGKGGMAVLNRKDTFEPYITYVGIRTEVLNGNSTRLLLFKVREEDKPEPVLKHHDMYLAYIILYDAEKDKYELKTFDSKSNTINIFRPEFKIVNQ